jgi:hypothetical protein
MTELAEMGWHGSFFDKHPELLLHKLPQLKQLAEVSNLKLKIQLSRLILSFHAPLLRQL